MDLGWDSWRWSQYLSHGGMRLEPAISSSTFLFSENNVAKIFLG